MPTATARGSRRPRARAPSLAAAVRAVQIHYPQIYMACHTRHTRARSSAVHLSGRDSGLLVHLDEERPTRPAALARHLGIGAPTLSAALKRLEALGYVTRSRQGTDRRAIALRLSPRGAEALSASSVLETARVRALLRTMAPPDRAAAIAGLALLGRAACALEARARAEA
jgi:DNA-binding MarR family transcriptional regulator